MESYLMETSNIKLVSGPAALNGAATTGARVSMAAGERITFVVAVGASTGSTLSFSLKQHNAATSGTTKTLAIKEPVFKKVGAATTFTKVEAPLVDTLDLSTDYAANAGIVVIEVLQENLDVNGNFAYVSLNLADSVTAKSASILAIVRHGRTVPTYTQSI